MNSLDIVVAFGGGIFGAAVGALAAFEFVGLLVIAMTVVQIITGASSDFITFPFGLFGPHTGGFAAGVAATAYAAKKGKLGSGRDITAGLSGLAAYDVLLVGGVFGTVGYIIAWGLNQIPAFPSGNAWTDTVALTVVISGVVSRLVSVKLACLENRSREFVTAIRRRISAGYLTIAAFRSFPCWAWVLA